MRRGHLINSHLSRHHCIPFLFLFILSWSCQGCQDPPTNLELTGSQKEAKPHVRSDRPAVTDLQEFSDLKNPAIESKVQSISQKYLLEKCTEDPAYCGELYLKQRKYYKDGGGTLLFCLGYSYKDSESVIDSTASSLFVYGIYANDLVVWYDVAADLLGQVQVDLDGYAEQGQSWGKRHSFFDTVQRGQFMVRVEGGQATYTFQTPSGS
jgi:hypothetical protein